MPEPTLADLFAEARTLLEGKTVERAVMFSNRNRRAFTVEPDPAYDALRKVVEVQRYPISLIAEIYWEQAPDGALEGALIKPLLSLGTVAHMAVDGLLDDIGTLLETEGDTRIPAMQALVEWLKGEA